MSSTFLLLPNILGHVLHKNSVDLLSLAKPASETTVTAYRALSQSKNRPVFGGWCQSGMRCIFYGHVHTHFYAHVKSSLWELKKSHYIVKVVVVCVQVNTVPLKALKQTQNHSFKLKPLRIFFSSHIFNSCWWQNTLFNITDWGLPSFDIFHRFILCQGFHYHSSDWKIRSDEALLCYA